MTRRFFCSLLCIIMLATTSITSYATSPSLGAEAYNEDSSEIVLYEEDFDDYTGTVAFGNGIDYETGWIYSRKSSNSQAYIQDGKLYFFGSGYDILYRDGGSTWGKLYCGSGSVLYHDIRLGRTAL